MQRWIFYEIQFVLVANKDVGRDNIAICVQVLCIAIDACVDDFLNRSEDVTDSKPSASPHGG